MHRTSREIAISRTLGVFLVLQLVFFPAIALRAQNASASPQVALESGDLIWPKKPGVVVPYNSQPGKAGNDDATRWENERDAYLTELRKTANPTEEEKERYKVLKAMDYREFLSLYLDDVSPNQSTTFGNGPVSVGHVGIIKIENGNPFVIEAIVKPGVRKISYENWLRERPGELIWIGRLKGVPSEKRAAVAKIAEGYIGRPYRFWNFNLVDDSGFYCSKLAWLSILKGAGFPPDGKENPNRALWFSPKQLIKSRTIGLLVNPGNYGTR